MCTFALGLTSIERLRLREREREREGRKVAFVRAKTQSAKHKVHFLVFWHSINCLAAVVTRTRMCRGAVGGGGVEGGCFGMGMSFLRATSWAENNPQPMPLPASMRFPFAT